MLGSFYVFVRVFLQLGGLLLGIREYMWRFRKCLKGSIGFQETGLLGHV